MSGVRRQAPSVAPAEIHAREQLARALTELRMAAGLSVRELARRLETPTATVGDYCSGRHLPGPAQLELFRSLLRVCGVQERDLDDWLDAVQRLRAGTDGRMRRSVAPYRGLEPFQVEDHDRFFGRESATEDVLTRLRKRTAAPGSGLVMIVGPSGVGKSSLLRAGVEAQVRAGALDSGGDRWSTAVVTPGGCPLDALRDGVADLKPTRGLLIVDQFEDIFGASADERDRFLAELEGLTRSGILTLGGLRADFYAQAVRVPTLLASLRTDQVLLGPMTTSELRNAIVGPARCEGAQVEEGLVELVLADLAPREPTGFAHEAGSLPLLSHALLQSWQRARGNRLTIADYRAAGGLHGAVRQSAEELYMQLTTEEQELARRVFMRLVRVPEDGPAIRRRAARRELSELGRADRASEATATDDERAEALVARFVAARLITIDMNTVELSHEALLSAWPRLAGWLDQNRADLRLHRQLTDAANQWIGANRDPALLLRGPRLQLIAGWAGDPEHRAELNGDERALFDASQTAALSERRAERRRARRMRELLLASVAFGIAALALTVIALHANSTATRARDDALSRQVALQAQSLAPTDPGLAMQLAVLAHRVAPTTDATSALLDASTGELPTRILGPIGPSYLATSSNAGELAVAYSSQDEVRVYTLAGGPPRLIASLVAGPASDQVFAVAVSPDGRLLAAGGTDHRVTLWNISSPTHPARIATLAGMTGTVYGLSFSVDGRRLAAVDAGRAVYSWSVSGGRHVQAAAQLVAPPSTSLYAVEFDPDGRAIAAAGTGGRILIWNLATGDPTPAEGRAPGGTTLEALSFSPNGRILAAGGESTSIYRWILNDADRPISVVALHGFTSRVDSLAFSPSGRDLAAGGADNSLRIWSAGSRTPISTLGNPASVTGVAFASDGARLLSSDAAGTLRAWTFPPPSAWRSPGSVFGLDFTTDGDELAVISSGPGGNAALWRTSDPSDPALVANIAEPRSFGAVAGAGALTGNGKLLAVANARAQIRLIDVSDPRHPRQVGPLLTGATPYVEQMAFDPTGRLLAAGDDAGEIRLWNVTRPNHPIAEPTMIRRGPAHIVLGVAFSPNGRLLATAATNGQVGLWNVTQPNHPRAIATPGRLQGYAYTVAFTPNGRTLIAAGANRTVHLWNVADPSRPRPIGRPLAGPTSTIYDLAVSPDGATLGAATTNGSVWLWNIAHPTTPKLTASLTSSSTDLYAVSFQPRSHALIAAGADQTLHVWDDSPPEVTSRVCKLAGTPLTRSEWSEYVEAGPYDPPCRTS